MILISNIVPLLFACVASHPTPALEHEKDRDNDVIRIDRIDAATDESQQPWRDEIDIWLEDFEIMSIQQDLDQFSDFDGMMLGDEPYESYDYIEEQTSMEDVQNCPIDMPVMASCNSTICVSDDECDMNFKCCYNGCITTCVFIPPTAPLIDWAVHPKPLHAGSSSWLIETDPSNDEKHGCQFEGRNYAEEETFINSNLMCKCIRRQITCSVLHPIV